MSFISFVYIFTVLSTSQTFFIADTNSRQQSSKAARACNACYDTVFPVINASPSDSCELTTPNDGTLSSLPVWKTTKENGISASALALLANLEQRSELLSSRPFDGMESTPDLRQDYPARSGDSSRTASQMTVVDQEFSIDSPIPRANKRLSAPVLALQTTAVTIQSDTHASPQKQHSMVSTPATGQGTPSHSPTGRAPSPSPAPRNRAYIAAQLQDL